ncbi:MAG: hypothetical protein ACI4J7_10430 [Ruminiclostridium sp.]
MGTSITKEFLQEHFRKHNSLTVYKNDGTPVTFEKKYRIAMCGGNCKITFKTCDEFTDFFNTRGLYLNSVITID